MTRGPARVMPHGQTRGSTCGCTRGIRPPQCPFQHVCLCPGRSGRAEIIPWSSLVWVRHVSSVYRKATSTKVFCQAACRFGVCPLRLAFRILMVLVPYKYGTPDLLGFIWTFPVSKAFSSLAIICLHSAISNHRHHVALPLIFS